MTRIRVTFYTGSDSFTTDFSVDDARAWIRSRSAGPSVITGPDGTRTGLTADQASPVHLARWFAAITLAETARQKALNVRECPGRWVSIRPEKIEAVSAEAIEDEAGQESPCLMLTSELWESLPTH